jgi:hypothetical protein
MAVITGSVEGAGAMLAWPVFEAGAYMGSVVNVAMSPCNALTGL